MPDIEFTLKNLEEQLRNNRFIQAMKTVETFAKGFGISMNDKQLLEVMGMMKDTVQDKDAKVDPKDISQAIVESLTPKEEPQNKLTPTPSPRPQLKPLDNEKLNALKDQMLLLKKIAPLQAQLKEQLEKGEVDKAAETMKKIAEVSKKPVSKEDEADFKDVAKKAVEIAKDPDPRKRVDPLALSRAVVQGINPFGITEQTGVLAYVQGGRLSKGIVHQIETLQDKAEKSPVAAVSHSAPTPFSTVPVPKGDR